MVGAPAMTQVHQPGRASAGSSERRGERAAGDGEGQERRQRKPAHQERHDLTGERRGKQRQKRERHALEHAGLGEPAAHREHAEEEEPDRRGESGEAGRAGADGRHVPDDDHAEPDHVVRDDVEGPAQHRGEQEDRPAQLGLGPEVDGDGRSGEGQE
jgi:hypothetical protein